MESFGKVDQNKNPYASEFSDELEKRTMHLTGHAKTEAQLRILENEKGIKIPPEERIQYYINYVQETTKGEPEEEVKKILEILESEGVFNKEELEILILGEKSELTQTEKETVKSVFKKESKLPSIIKKILILGVALGTIIGSIVIYKYKKDKNTNEKNKPLPEQEKKKPVVNKKDEKIINLTKTPNYDFGEGEKYILTENKDLEYKKIGAADLENIPVDLEKQIEFFKNLDFIKSNFYVLDKSNKLKPTLYEITKGGKIVSAEIVGIGKETGDNTFGMTTPAGIYAFSKWIEQEDLDLYGENGILRLLGYSISGETVDDIGVHIIYPPEKEERTLKMLNPESSKEISHRCINVFSEYFGKILKNYTGEGKLFIAIMQEENAFEKEKWDKITKKTSEDMKKLEKAGDK